MARNRGNRFSASFGGMLIPKLQMIEADYSHSCQWGSAMSTSGIINGKLVKGTVVVGSRCYASRPGRLPDLRTYSVRYSPDNRSTQSRCFPPLAETGRRCRPRAVVIGWDPPAVDKFELLADLSSEAINTHRKRHNLPPSSERHKCSGWNTHSPLPHSRSTLRGWGWCLGGGAVTYRSKNFVVTPR